MILPPPIRNTLRNNRIVRWLYFDCHFADIPVLLGVGSFNHQLNNALNEFMATKELHDEECIKETIKDVKRCFYRYKTTPQEYFLFKFKHKSQEERASYISDHIIMKLVANKSGRKIHDTELNNKFSFYTLNKDYFKRKAFFFNTQTTIDNFEKFVVASTRFIAKPNGAALGNGVEIFNLQNAEEIKKTFDYLKAQKIDYILEDLIMQNEEMSEWNHSSVNTIRINSFLNNDQFNVLCPFIRTGRKGSIVDNGGQGGIFASIDKKSGKIITDGMDEKGNEFQFHPDSGIQYIGWQVPKWEELIHLAEEIHRNMSKHNYISWDFALTDEGWVLIEGNWGEFVCQQMTNKRGYKNEFIQYLNVK